MFDTNIFNQHCKLEPDVKKLNQRSTATEYQKT